MSSKNEAERKPFRNVRKDFSSFESDPYVQKWLADGGYKDSGKRERLGLISRYCEFFGKTPSELIKEKHEDMLRDALEKTRVSELQLVKFDDHLRSEGMFHNSIVNFNGRIGGFYRVCGVPLQFKPNEMPKMIKKRSKDAVWREGEEGKAVKKDDKKLVLKKIRDAFQNTRDRAFFLTRLSTGLNDGTLRSLKVKDFRRGYREEYGICYISGVRAKDSKGTKGEFFQTFISSEACPMIELYLTERTKTREKEPDDNDWLFISRKRDTKGRDKKMSENAFRENLAEVCNNLGVSNITPTSFRRYFNTTLKRAGIERDIVERMMGHVGEVSAYYQELFDDEEALIQYFAEKVDPMVCLGNGNKKYEHIAKKLENLEKDNTLLKGTLKAIIEGLKGKGIQVDFPYGIDLESEHISEDIEAIAEPEEEAEEVITMDITKMTQEEIQDYLDSLNKKPEARRKK